MCINMYRYSSLLATPTGILVDLVLGTPMLLLVSPYRVVIGSDVSGVLYIGT